MAETQLSQIKKNFKGKKKEGKKTGSGPSFRVKAVTIRLKLMISFVIMIVLIILLGVVSFNKAAEGIRNSYELSTQNSISVTAKYLQLGAESIEALSTQYASDDVMITYLSGDGSGDTAENKNEYDTISDAIKAKELTDDFISNIYILSDQIQSVTTSSSALEGNICGDFYATEEGKIVADSTLKPIWIGSDTYLDEKLGIGPDNYAMRLCRYISKKSVLVIDMDYKTVSEILKDMHFMETGSIGLVTGDGKEIISGKMEDAKGAAFYNTDYYKDALKSGNTDGAYYINLAGVSTLFIYSKIGDTGAMICAIIPKSAILSQADSIKNITIIIVLIACAVAVIIGYLISNNIDSIIKGINKKLKRSAQGDLTVEFNTKRRDEFYFLIQEIKNTFDNMKSLINQVSLLSVDVSDASVDVKGTSEHFLKASKEISTAMNEIEQGIMQQAKDSEECLLQMDDLSSSIAKMSDNTVEIKRITENTKTSITNGTLATRELNNQTKSTMEITDDIVKGIEQLARESKSIYSIINVINDISNQTNLLSLNASIEAARAGEYGKGFSVVANEIGNLADQTKKSVQEIRHIIESIEKNTKELVNTAKRTEDVMSLQENAVTNTTNSYITINENVDNLMLQLNQVTNNVKLVETARVKAMGAIENISAVLEEIAASSSNVSQITDANVRSVEVLNQSAQVLNGNSEQLVQAIQRFTVN